MTGKLHWQGKVISVQPRIRLWRSFDQRSHTYLGFALHIEGVIEDEANTFRVGIGKAAQARHQFRVGDVVQGESQPVEDARKEPVEYYKTARMKVLERNEDAPTTGPPWTGIPQTLEVYRARGHRRLDSRTYSAKCNGCIWGCRMPVEMIIDQWNPGQVRYRFETFCYGPRSCAFYKAGPLRKVSGRRGMIWEEADWIDEEATSHRGPDD